MIKTRIAAFNLDKEDIAALNEKIEHVFDGSVGNRTNVPNTYREDNHFCQLNLKVPLNFHEYDIFIIDLQKKKPLDYKSEEHVRTNVSGSSTTVLNSSYPQTIFDAKPYGLHFLGKKIKTLSQESIFIVFAEGNYETEYQPILLSPNSYPEKKEKQRYSLYNFYEFPISQKDRSGKITKVKDAIPPELKKILSKHNDELYYKQVFEHPLIWNEESQVSGKSPFFHPLIFNKQDEIISYVQRFKNLSMFVFPQIKEKSEFLLEFLLGFAPSMTPELFPDIVKNEWRNQEGYLLPNHKELLEERRSEIEKHKEALSTIDLKIKKNNNEFGYLHGLLINTGDDLVNSVIKFLSWLGFSNVRDYDSEKEEGGVLEEDIQIETTRGLVIIEVKGIGGTSKDSECSQISKIKYRRCKERKAFDVFAHYIVNHQRHMPPLERRNPPFSEDQRKDAENEERGLVSTWQLYQLYYWIQGGIISKEEARNKFYEYGLLNFKPDREFIGKALEIFKNGQIVIVNLDKVKLNVGDAIIVEKGGSLRMVKIVSMQKDSKNVKEASEGEYGIQLSGEVQQNSMLYRKNNN